MVATEEVPDFCGAGPWPDDGFDPSDNTRYRTCVHGAACRWAMDWADDDRGYPSREWESNWALTDGGVCAGCTLYEREGGW
ncbi:MAG: hypothetical protein MSA61_01055 [Coriobacteriaceae bacterium]|nr:hypothetical protein [Coriobacteriaceae bacterium]